jgi:hypothetical protein
VHLPLRTSYLAIYHVMNRKVASSLAAKCGRNTFNACSRSDLPEWPSQGSGSMLDAGERTSHASSLDPELVARRSATGDHLGDAGAFRDINDLRQVESNE